jgi:hypothetical protein
MHDNPRPTEEEQELAQHERRQREEESMRGGAFDDPEAERDSARDEDGER